MIPTAILIHVQNVALGIEWYQKAFPTAVSVYHPSFDFTVLN